MYSHDLLRYVDPPSGWKPSPQLRRVITDVLTCLEEVGITTEADAAKVILALRLSFEALAPGQTLEAVLSSVHLQAKPTESEPFNTGVDGE